MDLSYPYAFTTLPKVDQPKEVFTTGNTSLLSAHCIAVIGTREPTEKGTQTAFNLAAHFAALGYTIVSGGAPGIDTAAHRGALSVGGMTTCILGSSLNAKDMRDPDLCRDIVQGNGLLLSMYSEGTGTQARYTARDKLMVALSLMIIPVQAEAHSGTLKTAQYALGYKGQKRVVVVPQPLKSESDHPAYQGIHELIAKGQVLVIRNKAEYRGFEALLNDLIALHA